MKRKLLLLISVMMLISFGLAMAANATGSVVGLGKGSFFYDVNNKLHWGGVIIVEVEGQRAGTFCTDLFHPITIGDEIIATDQTIDCRIKWLIHTYPPALSGIGSTEAAARQAAVWHFADNLIPKQTDSVGRRAWEIINEINALTNDGANPELACADLDDEPFSLDLSPASVIATHGDSVTLTVTATQGETPLANLTVTLDSNLGTLSQNSLTTDANGQAEVTLSAPPSTVTATNAITATATYTLPQATVFEGVDVQRQKLVLGQAVTGKVFAYSNIRWQTAGDVTVHLFHDRNMDETQGKVTLEENLVGWPITLTNQTGEVVGSGVTDSAGNLTISDLPNGTYTARYGLQSNWLPTTATEATVTVNNDSQMVAFGAVQAPVVIAYKFNDVDGDGQLDGDEPLLADWQMSLYEGEGDFVLGANGLTNDAGKVVLSFLRYSEFSPGSEYAVRVTPQAGWLPTTPTEQPFTLNDGQVVEVYFGSRQPVVSSQLTVIKQANRVASFDFTGDLGAFSLSSGQAQTFTNLIAGTYTVAEDPTSFASPFWTLISVICVDTATEMRLEGVSRTAFGATIPLAEGQHLTCTYLNEEATVDEEPTPAGQTIYLPLIQTSRAEAAFEAEVVSLINEQRQQNGCPALTVNGSLTQAAQAHSQDMAAQDYFDHITPTGLSPADRVAQVGYTYITIGENIAIGEATPQAVVDGWLSSGPHRQNIFDCELTETGVGYAYLAEDGGEVVAFHYWTQLFGTPQE